MLSKDDIWNVIDTYFKEKGLVKHQLDSYDELISVKIPKIVEDCPPIELKKDSSTYIISFKNITITKPQVTERDNSITSLTPTETRLRNLTYESTIFVNAELSTYENDTLISTKKELINLCNIPVMVGSKLCITHNLSTKGKIEFQECEFDQGGYFIINGSEKALIAQERMATNNVYVFLNKNNNYVAEIRSVQEGDVKSANQILVKYIKPNKKNIVTENVFRVAIPYLKKDIPLTVLFKAFGDYTITDYVDKENIHVLEPSLEEGLIISSTQKAREYIVKRCLYTFDTDDKKEEFIDKLLTKDILSHTEEDFKKKCEFIGYMVNKLILTIKGKRELDDRDHWGNKRIDLSSNLIGSLFRSSFYKVIKDYKLICEKNLLMGKNISLSDFRKDVITKDIKYALSTGNWTVNRQKITKTGVSQVLSRLSYLATLSHLRRIVAPIAKDGKSAKPRQLHMSSFGIVDCAETPEGHACGIVKNMSLTCHISLSFNSEIIEDFISSFITEDGVCKVLINGKLFGRCNDANVLTDFLRGMRRRGMLSFDVSIVNKKNEITINTDGGRCCRPLLVVGEGNKLNLRREDLFKDWKTLINDGKIEYLDVNECENALIAMDVELLQENVLCEKYTHCELHPSVIMSVCSGIIPYPDHNQAPRNCYQSSMSKQAMGIYATNYDTRMDTMSQVLFYPQKRLVEPKTSKYVNFPDIPAGMNAIVAIMCHTGFNGWTLSQ